MQILHEKMHKIDIAKTKSKLILLKTPIEGSLCEVGVKEDKFESFFIFFKI